MLYMSALLGRGGKVESLELLLKSTESANGNNCLPKGNQQNQLNCIQEYRNMETENNSTLRRRYYFKTSFGRKNIRIQTINSINENSFSIHLLLLNKSVSELRGNIQVIDSPTKNIELNIRKCSSVEFS